MLRPLQEEGGERGCMPHLERGRIAAVAHVGPIVAREAPWQTVAADVGTRAARHGVGLAPLTGDAGGVAGRARTRVVRAGGAWLESHARARGTDLRAKTADWARRAHRRPQLGDKRALVASFATIRRAAELIAVRSLCANAPRPLGVRKAVETHGRDDRVGCVPGRGRAGGVKVSRAKGTAHRDAREARLGLPSTRGVEVRASLARFGLTGALRTASTRLDGSVGGSRDTQCRVCALVCTVIER